MGGKVIILMGLFLVLIISQIVKAQTENQPEQIPSEVISSEDSHLDYSLEDVVADAVQIINQLQLQSDAKYQIGKTDVADTCVAFVDKNQFLGSDGAFIFKLITENAKLYPNLLKGGDINNFCPKYSRMNAKEKGLVWVVVMTMIAHFESSCKSSISAAGPNGTAQGYYQLHKGHEMDYTDMKAECPKNASLDSKKSSRCALATLETQFIKKNGKLFSPDSYWDVLRPQAATRRAAEIKGTLKRMALCNPISS